MGVAGLLVVLAILVAVLAFRANGGNGGASGGVRYGNVKVALEARLNAQYLSYRWVVCTRMSQRFHAVRVSRCNVNFGDPHIVPYCAVLVKGALVTDQENQAVDCGARNKADEQGHG
jgi:hypothetical protein